jgi:hypothetical protein
MAHQPASAVPLPFVQFDPTSAPVTECLEWAIKAVVAGEFSDSIVQDFAASWLVMSRMAHGAILFYEGGQPLTTGGTDTPDGAVMSQKMTELARAVNVPVPAHGAGAFPWQQVIMAAIQLFLEYWRRKQQGGQ